MPVFARDRAHGNKRGDIGDDAKQYLQEKITLNDDTGIFQMASDEFFIAKHEPIPATSPMGSETSTTKTSQKQKRSYDGPING